MKPVIDRLAAAAKIPVFVTTLAQGGINEASPYYKGIYSGPGSMPQTKDLFEQSDLVLHIGPHNTDVSTFLRGAAITHDSSINIHQDHIELCGKMYRQMHLKSTVECLLSSIEGSNRELRRWAGPNNSPTQAIVKGLDGDPDITHDWLWSNVSEYLRQGDIVVAETGTASFGIFDTRLPNDCTLINPSIWASIGYGVAGAQGAALAAKDEGLDRRTVLFEGDGSFQLTCQELSTMIRRGLRVTM